MDCCWHAAGARFARTTGQLSLYGETAAKGDWLYARIETPLLDLVKLRLQAWTIA